MNGPSAYEVALEELAAAEREAARQKTASALHRVLVARARATALFQRPQGKRVGIGNR